MARPGESAPRYAQDVFFLEETNELDVIRKRTFGEKIKGPARDRQVVTEPLESAYKPVSFALVYVDVYAHALETHYQPLHKSGRVDETQNPV